MCDFAKYPELYQKANAVLRNEGINPEVPGYELLKRAIVVYIVEKPENKEQLLKEVKQKMLIPANKDLNLANKGKRGKTEQWMVEAIRSEGVDNPLMDYIKKLAKEIET